MPEDLILALPRLRERENPSVPVFGIKDLEGRREQGLFYSQAIGFQQKNKIQHLSL